VTRNFLDLSDMLVVSRRLGHSSLSLTADTYTQVLNEVQLEAAELIARSDRRYALQRRAVEV
jgi:integrase